MATAIVRVNNVSGTNFTLDVAALELDSNLSVKDFIVTHNGINVTTSYTKTNSTQITYAGTSVALGVIVQVERDTTLTNAEVTFLSVTTAQDLTNALNKLKRRVEEAEAYATYVSQQLTQGGILLGVNPISDAAFGASWDADTTTAPSRNAVYDRFNALTSGATPVSVPTITPGKDSTANAASTAFVQSAIDNRTRLIATRSTISGNIATGSWQDIPLNVELIDRDNAYNTSSFTWTVTDSGLYRLDWYCQVISTGGTNPTKVSQVVGFFLNGTTNMQAGVTEADTNYAPGIGHTFIQLTAGSTIRPRCFITTTGGSGFNMVFGGDPTFMPFWTITKLY